MTQGRAGQGTQTDGAQIRGAAPVGAPGASVGLFGTVLRYWHTLRYLRPVQIHGRIRFRLARTRPDLRPAPPLRGLDRAVWLPPAPRAPRLTGRGVFDLLGQTGRLDEIGWDGPERDRLWRYTQHYFEDLGSWGALGVSGQEEAGAVSGLRGAAPSALAATEMRDAGPVDLKRTDGQTGPEARTEAVMEASTRAEGVAGSVPDEEADQAVRRAWHHALVTDWIARNPPGQGTGWEPYPLSLRMVNWIKWALAGETLDAQARHSLAVQARWLTRRLEWHLQGNHLWSNAKALVCAGVFFDGAEADAWLAQGIAILMREIDEQILPDGGQFERSPMYHALAYEGALDLVNLLGCLPEPSPSVRALRMALVDRLPAMGRWLAALTHPGGGLAFFNDTAMGVAPETSALLGYAARLGIGSAPVPEPLCALAASGYVRAGIGCAVLLADLAPVGPDHQPGHAHADTLSFELSLGGQRVVVNGGISEYGTGPERLRQRGTAAHATVVVAGQDSSEVWGGFRVARRARITQANSRIADEGIVIEGGHDGYTRLRGGPEHHRRWELSAQGLVVRDRLISGGVPLDQKTQPWAAQARFPLHPDVRIETIHAQEAYLCLPCGLAVLCRVGPGRLHVKHSLWHPGFGRSVASRCLVVTLEAGQAEMALRW